MDLKLNNKTAFISGSTAGIGFAIAQLLLQEGASVIINGRTTQRIETAIEKLKDCIPNANVRGIAADFSKNESVQQLLAELPPVDILVNNVGIFSAQSFEETTDEDWLNQFEVNVMSGVRLARHCLPQMLEQNWGRILFISSECATIVPDDLIAYSMTKAAILPISRGLAQLTKGTEVTVNTIIPGSTFSEGAQRFLEGVASREQKTVKEIESEFFTEVRTSSLLQRFATVEEVASMAAYLMSPLAVATNGAAIRVDGGSMGGII